APGTAVIRRAQPPLPTNSSSWCSTATPVPTPTSWRSWRTVFSNRSANGKTCGLTGTWKQFFSSCVSLALGVSALAGCGAPQAVGDASKTGARASSTSGSTGASSTQGQVGTTGDSVDGMTVVGAGGGSPA